MNEVILDLELEDNLFENENERKQKQNDSDKENHCTKQKYYIAIDSNSKPYLNKLKKQKEINEENKYESVKNKIHQIENKENAEDRNIKKIRLEDEEQKEIYIKNHSNKKINTNLWQTKNKIKNNEENMNVININSIPNKRIEKESIEKRSNANQYINLQSQSLLNRNSIQKNTNSLDNNTINILDLKKEKNINEQIIIKDNDIESNKKKNENMLNTDNYFNEENGKELNNNTMKEKLDESKSILSKKSLFFDIVRENIMKKRENLDNDVVAIINKKVNQENKNEDEDEDEEMKNQNMNKKSQPNSNKININTKNIIREIEKNLNFKNNISSSDSYIHNNEDSINSILKEEIDEINNKEVTFDLNITRKLKKLKTIHTHNDDNEKIDNSYEDMKKMDSAIYMEQLS